MESVIPEDLYEHRLVATWSSDDNQSSTVLPLEMKFNDGHLLSIVVYSVLLVVSAVGNCTVLTLLLRKDTPKTRINTMLVHLAVADLLVTFLMMPTMIVWSWTVSWNGGDLVCRIMAFFKVFGLYLSSFVLICISVDRYYAVLKPLQLSGGERRSRALLTAAWISSAICSAPQIAIFHVERHPNVTWYEQCVALHAFSTPTQELVYSLLSLVLMYAMPLVTFLFCYASILREIIRRSRDSLDDKIMRRSSLGFLGRARSRTLKMTITIVLVFFICWTPYYVMALWWWIDPKSAEKVDHRVQRGLFLFACTNSCMNPLVYGAFNVRARAQRSTRGGVTHHSVKRRDLYSCGESLELPPHSSSRRK